MTDLTSPSARARRLLNAIAVVAVVDFALLIPLALGFLGLVETKSFVSALGMVHGVGFLALLAMTGQGARRKWWGWWFPAITVITGGAIGSLVGDALVRRGLRHDLDVPPLANEIGRR
ncbi:hypothetical protein AB0L40_05160 [Patulibacter sp. NPDC049589]|uniref:hypothetical protein n=1 Tax=Patulibacter sp. NPDC049589 TaxID=3154731 RepID=UPI00343F69BC